MASWVKEEKRYNPDPNPVLARMEETKSVSNEGKVSFAGFVHMEHLVLLNSMIKVDDEIPEVEKRRMISQATSNTARNGIITPQSLINQINRLERQYLSTQKTKCRLISNISISTHCKFPKVYFDGSCIVVHAQLNKKIKSSRNRLKNDAKHSLHSAIPNNYVSVSVSVNAHSAAEAAEKALYRLDFVRGIWNLG